MKIINLLALTLPGLLALVSAHPDEEAYASAWGYYGSATVITGPTNVDEFGMPIAKKTGMPGNGQYNSDSNAGSPNGGNPTDGEAVDRGDQSNNDGDGQDRNWATIMTGSSLPVPTGSFQGRFQSKPNTAVSSHHLGQY